MQLDTIYAEPGTLLLAVDDAGERLGCVGLRSLGDGSSEVRRLFVRSAGRGTGLGRALVAQVIQHARDVGTRRLVLNTLPEMVEAIALYTALGFEPCRPYVVEPLEGTLYFALDLKS